MPRKTPQLSVKDLFENGQQYYLPHISIDNVIFGFHDNELKVLLLQWNENGRWCLPGGFVLKDEDIQDAAARVLKSRTSLSDIFLSQFHTFGSSKRKRRRHGIDKPKWLKADSWFMDRFITIGYWALVEFSKVIPKPDEFSMACQWCDIDKVPKLILDHNDILDHALFSLRRNLNEFPLGKDLLPTNFTMPELQRLYETVLNKKLDRRNFQKKILGLDILIKLQERKQGGAHKAPFLYKFDRTKYKKAMKSGLKSGLQ
ncbi:MAG: NUDIX domain-containing protein [Chryseolinea sp.]